MVDKVHFSSDKADWGTPAWLIEQLKEEGYDLALDVCARPGNAKANYWITPETDTFAVSWGAVLKACGQAGAWCWMNPPYRKPERACKPGCKKKRCQKRNYHLEEYLPGTKDYVQKAHEEAERGVKTIALLPNRPAKWWIGPLLQETSRPGLYRSRYEMRGFATRLHFEGAPTGAPFPSVLVFMDCTRPGMMTWQLAKPLM